MKIKFDAYEVAQSPLHGEGTTYSRPAVINQQTTTTKDIMEKACDECTLTSIDISAVIGSLARQLRLELLQGNAVHLDGIGTFSLSLKFDDAKKAKEDFKARDVRVAGVNFTPDRGLLFSVQNDAKFERVTALRSSRVSEGEAVIFLRQYFQEHKNLTKQTFQTLLDLKYGRATSLLLSLTKKKKLTVSRMGQTNIYFPGPTL